MKKPTLEEVKEYFKNAEKVECANSRDVGYVELDKIKECEGDSFVQNAHRANWLVLWIDTKGYAKILTYKTKQMKPKKEETKALYQLAKEAIEAPTNEVCQQWKDRIFDACPSLKKEDIELIKGQWYKNNNGSLVYAIEVKNKEIYGYGIDNRGVWNKECDMSWADFDNPIKADPKEVESMLIGEAKKRGFNHKVEFIALDDSRNGSLVNDIPMVGSSFDFENNTLYTYGLGRWCIFKDGQWASLIESISLKEAEKLLNKKIKVD